MALIQSKKPIEKIKINFNLSADLKGEIEKYCDWAKVSTEEFFSQAAEFVLKKDRDWAAHSGKTKKRKQTT